MTRAEIRERFTQYRDSIKGKKRNPNADWGNGLLEERLAYRELWDMLLETKCYDWSFWEHLTRGVYEKAIAEVDTFSFEECCTYLSVIPRTHRLHGSFFWICIEDGSIYKLLSRAIEVM